MNGLPSPISSKAWEWTSKSWLDGSDGLAIGLASIIELAVWVLALVLEAQNKSVGREKLVSKAIYRGGGGGYIQSI